MWKDDKILVDLSKIWENFFSYLSEVLKESRKNFLLKTFNFYMISNIIITTLFVLFFLNSFVKSKGKILYEIKLLIVISFYRLSYYDHSNN